MASIVPVTTEVVQSFTNPVSSTGGISTSDVFVSKAYPGLVFNGTEANSVYEEMREVSGDLWLATNAVFNTTTFQWNPNNALTAAFAIRLKSTGEMQRLVWPAAAGPITWILVDTIDAQGALSLTPTTFTSNAEIALNVAPTWNMGVQKATAFKVNVTDTASNTGSLLLDLQVGGVSKFRVDKNGIITASSGTASWLATVNAIGTATHVWPLNDPTGTVAVDAVGGSNGTYVGSPSLASPLAKQTGVGLNGTTQYVTFPTTEFPVAPWSIECYASSASSTGYVYSSPELSLQSATASAITTPLLAAGATALPQTSTISAGSNFTVVVDSVGNIYQFQAALATSTIRWGPAGGNYTTNSFCPIASADATNQTAYIDVSGNFWICQYANNQVLKYNSTGTTLLLTLSRTSAQNCVVDSTGKIYVLANSTGTNAVYVYPAAGGASTSNFAVATTPTFTSMAIDSSDNIYIATGASVKKYNTSGTLLLTISTGISSNAISVAVTPNGNIYIGYNNGSTYLIGQWASTGGIAVKTQAPTSATAPGVCSIASDSGGNIYVRCADGFVSKYSNGLTSSSLSVMLGAITTPHHYIATYDGTNIRFYIDGAFVSSGTVTITQSPGVNFIAGAYSYPLGSLPLTGTLGNVAIYSTQLTAPQISSLYGSL